MCYLRCLQPLEDIHDINSAAQSNKADWCVKFKQSVNGTNTGGEIRKEKADDFPYLWPLVIDFLAVHFVLLSNHITSNQEEVNTYLTNFTSSVAIKLSLRGVEEFKQNLFSEHKKQH